MAEDKTFNVIIGGDPLPVPCMPRLGHSLDIWRAIESHGKPTKMSEMVAYELAYIAAATQKPEAVIGKNALPGEAHEAVKVIDREWLASGFFVKAEPEAATAKPPSSDIGGS